MKQSISLLTLFLLLSLTACTQIASQNREVKVKLKVLHFLPVGWGVKYKAVITERMEGDNNALADTIVFGIIDAKTYGDLTEGDVRVINFTNSGKTNEQPYMPAINGTVSKHNEIWLITKMVK